MGILLPFKLNLQSFHASDNLRCSGSLYLFSKDCQMLEWDLWGPTPLSGTRNSWQNHARKVSSYLTLFLSFAKSKWNFMHFPFDSQGQIERAFSSKDFCFVIDFFFVVRCFRKLFNMGDILSYGKCKIVTANAAWEVYVRLVSKRSGGISPMKATQVTHDFSNKETLIRNKSNVNPKIVSAKYMDYQRTSRITCNQLKSKRQNHIDFFFC